MSIPIDPYLTEIAVQAMIDRATQNLRTTIDQLRGDLNNRLNGIVRDVDHIENNVLSDVRNDIGNIQSEISSIRTELSNLEHNVRFP